MVYQRQNAPGHNLQEHTADWNREHSHGLRNGVMAFSWSTGPIPACDDDISNYDFLCDSASGSGVLYRFEVGTSGVGGFGCGGLLYNWDVPGDCIANQ
mmetsp:Transcript_11229/g.16387  ORF Transcript_11229/g.16387 Transcript_11229/m.16387 type:complete len:98 (-) Transcript_11229:515-808(-)